MVRVKVRGVAGQTICKNLGESGFTTQRQRCRFHFLLENKERDGVGEQYSSRNFHQLNFAVVVLHIHIKLQLPTLLRLPAKESLVERNNHVASSVEAELVLRQVGSHAVVMNVQMRPCKLIIEMSKIKPIALQGVLPQIRPID